MLACLSQLAQIVKPDLAATCNSRPSAGSRCRLLGVASLGYGRIEALMLSQESVVVRYVGRRMGFLVFGRVRCLMDRPDSGCEEDRVVTEQRLRCVVCV